MTYSKIEKYLANCFAYCSEFQAAELGYSNPFSREEILMLKVCNVIHDFCPVFIHKKMGMSQNRRVNQGPQDPQGPLAHLENPGCLA